jgi:hypothetical protein
MYLGSGPPNVTIYNMPCNIFYVAKIRGEAREYQGLDEQE